MSQQVNEQEQLLQRVTTVTHGGGGRMMWACFAAKTTNHIAVLTMTLSVLRGISEPNLWFSLNDIKN